MGAPRLVRRSRHARPLALVSAVATLLAALFLCLGTGPEAEGAHHEEGPRTTAVIADHLCPYDPGGCSLFPALSPAVLSAPPLDAPPSAQGGPPRLSLPSGEGPASPGAARPRAPDLHVLQVLRT
ncbi:hypothetical protein ACFW2Y_22550 [Streptomyces sp. NPDC058877]|uniref:hypothetical protein n=1 Tax=unclassified Streptomyces TaxID=2593676 RepID=UPI0036A01E25